MLGLNIDVRHGIRAEPIEHSIPDRNMKKDQAGDALFAPPAYKHNHQMNGGRMANMKNYEDSPFLRTHQQATKGVPV
jgi:hypothetical protein